MSNAFFANNFESEVLTLLRLIYKNQGLILTALDKIMTTLDQELTAILADVTQDSTRIDGMNTLFAGLQAQLTAALTGNITPAMQAKVDQIFATTTANSARIDAALQANTTPTPTPAPTPSP